jgi:hypothetical protein
MALKNNHVMTGNLYLNPSGDGVINASGNGLFAQSVPFESLQRGTPGFLAMYKEVNPDAGMFTIGIAKSPTPSANAIMQWDSTGTLDGVTIGAGGITAGSIISSNLMTANSITINNLPTLPSQAATVQYVNNAISVIVAGVIWLEPVIDFQTNPALLTPADGDRYIALTTIGPWIKDNIYEWSAGLGSWVATVPVQGNALTSMNGYPYIATTEYISYIFTTAYSWIPIGFGGDHDDLGGKQGTNSTSSTQSRVLGAAANVLIHRWTTTANKVWTVSINLVGTSDVAAGHVVFSWVARVQNYLNVVTFTIDSLSRTGTGNMSTATAQLSVPAFPNNNCLDVSITEPDAINTTWHVTTEGTYTNI